MIPLAEVKEFERYLLAILEGLELDSVEREELLKEWEQHLNDLLKQYMDQGFHKPEAIKLALQQFGDKAELHAEVKRSYPVPGAAKWLKELLIWMLCLLAASIGPWLFVNARYSLFFVLFPLPVLLACAFFYYGLLTRVVLRPLWMIAVTVFLYASFLFLAVRLTSLEFVLHQFTALTPSGDGLFTMPGIHLLWIVIVAFHLMNGPAARAWKPLAGASFTFWGLNLAALLIVSSGLLPDSSEGNVIVLNLFLLYGTLHQLIRPRDLITTKNKLHYWIRRALP